MGKNYVTYQEGLKCLNLDIIYQKKQYCNQPFLFSLYFYQLHCNLLYNNSFQRDALSSIFERQMANRCSILPLVARRRHILKLSLFSSRLIGSCHFSSLNVILIFFVLVNLLATISESIYIPRSAYDSKGESSRTVFLRRYRSFGF